MKYIFILGRNIELSKAEVLAFLNKENNPALNEELNNNALLVELEKPLEKETVNKLGGTIAIGKVLTENLNNLDSINLYEGTKNKLNYCFWDFSEKYDEVKNYLKKRFKEEKLRATEKLLSEEIKSQSGESINLPSSKLIEEHFFIFNDCFGKLIKFTDAKAIESRDMDKPVRRESLAIAPRLAKILINLAEVKEGNTILDPFCGVGTILQEALLQNINVIGVDKDKDAIKGAKENLEFFEFKKENYTLINNDSTKVDLAEVSAVATEPNLGQIRKKIPTKDLAEKTLKDFEKLIIQVINNISKKVQGKIVFTSPFIRIGKKRIECNIEEICEKTNYNLINKFPEFRQNQIIGRMIYILK